MSRRYRAEPIEVTVGERGEPAVFRWRGRRYAVRVIVAGWVEALPWWAGDRSVDRTGRAGGQRHVWRVEAASRAGTVGVYDLYRIPDGWLLGRVLD